MTRFTPSKTKSEAEGLVRQWIDAALWRQEARLAETDGFAFLEPDEIQRMDRQDAIELEALLRFTDRMFAGEEKAKIERALGPGGPGVDAFDGIVQAVGGAINVPVDRETADGRFYSRMILRGHATLLDEMRETLAAIPKQVQASVEKPILPNFSFFKHWDEFVATKKSDRKWKRDTAGGAEATPRLFKALIGDLPLAQIDGSVVGRFRLEYLKLPFDHFHGNKWNKLTTKQVLAAVQKLDDAAKAKLRLTSTTTANKHVINLIEYWDHLALHAKIPRGLDNPFRGHFTAKPRGRAARDEHPMWPADLDQAFFTSPVYAGCKSIFRRGLPGHEIHRDALFWIPLFGRTMGVREDEICGRLVGDIDWVDTEIGLLPFLKIRNSKTSSSSRDVPLHELILRLGFLEHRYYGRQPDEPLFPELIAQGVEPRRSGAFSGRFTEYRKKTKTYRPGVDFRSYRGAVETALRNFPDVNAGWVDELIGHDSPIRRSEGARYTKSIFMPFFVYQLSLRLGSSYEATTWTLQRQNIITSSTGSLLRETKPRDLKAELLRDYRPSDFKGDVWHLTERDGGTRIDGSRNDHFVLDLNEHSGGGYVWDIEQLRASGFAIIRDDREATNPEGVGNNTVRSVIGAPDEPHRGLLSLAEIRPWIPDEPISELKLDYDFTGPEEEGLSRAERRQILEAAA